MVKYCCDRCKKEVKSEKYLYPVKVQSYLRDDVTTWLPAVSICAECLNDLALFLGSGEPRDYSLLTEITETEALNKISDLLESRWELGAYITLQRIKEIMKDIGDKQ